MKFILFLLIIISNTLCMPPQESTFGNNYLCYESGLNLGFGAKLRKVRCPSKAIGCMTVHYGKYSMIKLLLELKFSSFFQPLTMERSPTGLVVL